MDLKLKLEGDPAVAESQMESQELDEDADPITDKDECRSALPTIKVTFPGAAIDNSFETRHIFC